MIKSLQSLCVEATTKSWKKHEAAIPELSDNMKLTIIKQAISDENADVVKSMFLNLQMFVSFMEHKDHTIELYEALKICSDDEPLFVQSVIDNIIAQDCVVTTKNVVEAGEFFLECGWFKEAETLLMHFIGKKSYEEDKGRYLTFLTLIFSSRNANYDFTNVDEVLLPSDEILNLSVDIGFNRSLLFAELGIKYYSLNKNQIAFTYISKALHELKNPLNSSWTVNVLRKSARVAIANKVSDDACVLIEHALQFAGLYYGTDHLLYAECLKDWAYYLLQVNQIDKSVLVNETVVKMVDAVLGNNNLKSAVAHENLAYSLYVMEYDTIRNFQKPKKHAELCADILKSIAAPNHMLHASCNRVRALIYEELSIKEGCQISKSEWLQKAKRLHTRSLKQCIEVYGKVSMQVAMSYTNLGRLFHSDNSFEQAVDMYNRSLKIKIFLLGENSEELSTTLSCLASLYNYDLKNYDEAEKLYMKSIEIKQQHLARTWNDLVYDYQGLIHLYSATNKEEKRDRYIEELQENFYEDFNQNRY